MNAAEWGVDSGEGERVDCGLLGSFGRRWTACKPCILLYCGIRGGSTGHRCDIAGCIHGEVLRELLADLRCNDLADDFRSGLCSSTECSARQWATKSGGQCGDCTHADA